MNATTDSSLIDLLQQAQEYAVEYIDTLEQRPVYPDKDDLSGLHVFDETLPDNPTDPSALLKMLHEHGSPATVAQTGGRYFGFVNGATQPAALAARWLSDVWDQNPALYVMSPLASHLEQLCERWLIELLDLPYGTTAGLVSGSSISINCGLAAARYELLKRQGWDINAQGLYNAPRIRVIVGEQAHSAVFKAIALLGLGKDNIETVATDDQGRMRGDLLPALDETTLVITQAGNVNTGAFDPFDVICDAASSANAWVHVDGAFGLWAGASQATQHLYSGAQRADSWSADAHKTLNAPYDCGIILCRHSDALVSAMQASGAYLQLSEHRDPMMHTLDMSRRARAVDLWATLKCLGKSGVEILVDSLCARAAEFATELSRHGFRVLNDVVFNQVLVACDRPELTLETLKLIQQSGECWCGGSQWRGEPVIRISVCSWKTSHADVLRSVDAFVKARQTANSPLGSET